MHFFSDQQNVNEFLKTPETYIKYIQYNDIIDASFTLKIHMWIVEKTLHKIEQWPKIGTCILFTHDCNLVENLLKYSLEQL